MDVRHTERGSIYFGRRRKEVASVGVWVCTPSPLSHCADAVCVCDLSARISFHHSGGGFCVFQITSEINELLSRTRHNRFAAMNKCALFQPQHPFVLRPAPRFLRPRARLPTEPQFIRSTYALNSVTS